MKYDASNVTRGRKEDGENPGYFYAPCRVCGKRMNVGNYPPVIIHEGPLKFYVLCEEHEWDKVSENLMSQSDYLDYKYKGEV